MNKRTIIFFAILTAVIFIVVTNGHIISRAMLAHDTRFMYQAISRTILRQIPKDKLDIANELEFTNRYIYLNIQHYGNARDDGAGWMLLYGEAWCDSVSNIFIRLIAPLDIKGYLVFLRLPNGVSPHSVAYCTPGDISVRGIEYLQRNAIVVDPYNGIIYRTARSVFANPAQICNGLVKVPENISDQKLFYCEMPALFASNSPISTQPAFKRWFYRNIFPRIPESWIKGYIQFALVINNKLEKAERMYYLARLEQLFLNYHAAMRGYTDVINRYPETMWGELAAHWRDRIELPLNRFPETGK